MITILQILTLLYFILINLFYLVLFFISLAAILSYHRRAKNISFYQIRKSTLTPPISILVPAYNEGKTIVPCLISLLMLSYPQYEIIVVNDGSTDDTLENLKKTFKLRRTAQIYHRVIPTEEVKGIYKSTQFPNLVVVDKEQGGKSDALNCGINVSGYPLFCTIDADSILERDALLRVVWPFLNDYFRTVAAGGMVRVANGCQISNGMILGIDLAKKWLPNFQVVEYLRAFLSGRMGFSALNALLIISGAFSIFKKEAVVEVGGYRRDTVGEDMDLVVRMHQQFRDKKLKRNYRMTFIPDPICWTEVPENLKQLALQRNRWQRGLGETLLRYQKMLLNPRYGRIGLCAMPYFFFVEFLGPGFEFAGYLLMIFSLFTGQFAALLLPLTFFILAIVYGILLSLAAVLVEEFTLHRYPKIQNFFKLWGTAFLENFGYHQLTILWRLQGFWALLKADRSWGKLERAGLESRRK